MNFFSINFGPPQITPKPFSTKLKVIELQKIGYLRSKGNISCGYHSEQLVAEIEVSVRCFDIQIHLKDTNSKEYESGAAFQTLVLKTDKHFTSLAQVPVCDEQL